MQDSGPIGLRDTIEIAIIYMEDFELKVIETTPYRLVCMSMTATQGSKMKKLKESSVDHLNTIRPGVIEFTKEDQEGDTLPGII